MFNRKLKQDLADLQQQVQANAAVEAALSRAMAVIRFDQEGVILSANAHFLQALGYHSIDELRGKKHSQLCSREEVSSPAYNQFWDRLRRGEPFTGQVKRQADDGRVVWLEATYAPVRNSQGQVESYLKLASDITAQVAAQARNQAIHFAARQLAAFTRFCALRHFNLQHFC